jgi:single-strand DNA-binding protein
MDRRDVSSRSDHIAGFSRRHEFHTLHARGEHREPTVKEIQMHSFNVTAVGNLAKDPELNFKGETTFTRFCLVGNDYAGKAEDGTAREIVTGIYFVAFGGLAEVIARNTRKGDQLIVQAHVKADNWTDGEGEKQYDYSFVADTFRFGAPGKAKREELALREEQNSGALESAA